MNNLLENFQVIGLAAPQYQLELQSYLVLVSANNLNDTTYFSPKKFDSVSYNKLYPISCFIHCAGLINHSSSPIHLHLNTQSHQVTSKQSLFYSPPLDFYSNQSLLLG